MAFPYRNSCPEIDLQSFSGCFFTWSEAEAVPPWAARRPLEAFLPTQPPPWGPSLLPCPVPPVPQALGTTQHWYEHPSTPTPASPHFEKPRALGATVGSAQGFVRCFFT